MLSEHIMLFEVEVLTNDRHKKCGEIWVFRYEPARKSGRNNIDIMWRKTSNRLRLTRSVLILSFVLKQQFLDGFQILENDVKFTSILCNTQNWSEYVNFDHYVPDHSESVIIAKSHNVAENCDCSASRKNITNFAHKVSIHQEFQRLRISQILQQFACSKGKYDKITQKSEKT